MAASSYFVASFPQVKSMVSLCICHQIRVYSEFLSCRSLFMFFAFSVSGKKWGRLHFHPAWTWWGQVWLWETRGALATYPHRGDHHDQCYLHAGRPQWRFSSQCWCGSKCSGVSRTFLLGWPRWDTKLVWGGHGIAKFIVIYTAGCGSNPGWGSFAACHIPSLIQSINLSINQSVNSLWSNSINYVYL